MCARLLWPYLTTDVAVLCRYSQLQSPKPVREGSFYLRHFGAIQTHDRLTIARNRHRQARPIICVPFWAITSSLCVSISLFVYPLFFCL